MAVYKVPQDVEAEDHLIGPFGFRQFIYLIIAAGGCFVAYLLGQIFIGLILIPAPLILFFIAIALPLRKDQPTEVYLAAVLQFHLKSKRRMWQPDGVLSTVEITAPKKIEEKRTKDLSEDEALNRLGHLAQIMDTRGWAARGVFDPSLDTGGNVTLKEAVVEEANQAEDILDASSSGAQSFDDLIDQQKAISKQAVMEKMSEAVAEVKAEASVETNNRAPATVSLSPTTPAVQPQTPEDIAAIKPTYPSPYPTGARQKIVQPLKQNDQAPTNVAVTPPPVVAEVVDTSATPVVNPPDLSKQASLGQPSADIMDMAGDPDITVQTVAKAAKRIEKKEIEEKTDEVEIRLH